VSQVLDELEQAIRRGVTTRDAAGVRAVADALAKLADAGE
jgi:hypothetical protein